MFENDTIDMILVIAPLVIMFLGTYREDAFIAKTLSEESREKTRKTIKKIAIVGLITSSLFFFLSLLL